MREIPLSQGYVAIVDDEDYERVVQFKWSASVRRRRNGTIKTIYAMREEGAIMVLLHRFVLELPVGRIPLVDHRDGDGRNNQKANLRHCGVQQNAGNARKHFDTTSRFKGVYWDKANDKWRAQIKHGKKHESLGRFTSEVEAAKAYDAAARRLFGTFALTNFEE